MVVVVLVSIHCVVLKKSSLQFPYRLIDGKDSIKNHAVELTQHHHFEMSGKFPVSTVGRDLVFKLQSACEEDCKLNTKRKFESWTLGFPKEPKKS